MDATEDAGPLSTDDPVRPRPRIEGLSDLVFGLALSVGAIALVSSPPTTSLQIYTDLVSFAFSFLILISTWLSYTRIVSVMTFEDQWTISLNSLLLFVVSVEPFLFNVLVRSGNYPAGYFDTASDLYALDLAVMMTSLGLFAWTVATQEKPPLAPEARKSFQREALHRWFFAAIFLVSLLPIFGEIEVYNNPLRVWIWIIPLVVLFASRRLERHRDAT